MNKIETYNHRSRSQTYQAEVPSDAFIPKDVLSMIRPLYFMQIVFCCPKYWIKDNKILPNKYLLNILSFCFSIIGIAGNSYRFYEDINESKVWQRKPVIDCLFKSGSLLSIIIGFLVHCRTTVFYSNNIVIFFTKFITIHKLLNNKIMFKRSTICIWIKVIIFFCYESFVVLFICLSLGLFMYHIICGFLLVSFDANVLYAFILIQILKNKVDLWNMEHYKLEFMNDIDRKVYCERLYQAFVNIMDCYEQYCICFQQVVSKNGSLYSTIGMANHKYACH